MSQARQLYQLQELDDQIRQIQARLKEIHHTLHNDEAIQHAQANVEKTELALKPLRNQSKDLELDLESTTQKAEENENRLYSGAVTNTKEMQDMQNELASLKARQEKLEESMLDVMMQLETAEAAFHDAQATLEKTIKQRNAANESMLLEQENKQGKLQTLQHQREALRTNIEAAHLKIYDQLVPRTRGQAVTRMKSDGTCSLCGVQQTRTNETDIRRGNVTQCSNCRRILIF